jgi:hypothetical protein
MVKIRNFSVVVGCFEGVVSFIIPSPFILAPPDKVQPYPPKDG